jgi:site-specific DNA-methyltransferase (adenine-specific)
MDMKFDVVIGNPPYQLEAAYGESANTKVLYDKFVYFAKTVSDNISFVLPSNYLTGNKGPLKKFRKFIKTNGLVDISEDKSTHFNVNTAGISILTLGEHAHDTYTFQGIEITNDFTDSKIVANQKAVELYDKLCSIEPRLNCSRGKRRIYKDATDEYSTEKTDQYSVPMFLNTSRSSEEPNMVYVRPDSKMDVEVSHFAIVTQDWNKQELTFNKIWHRKMNKFTSNMNFIYFLLDESETFESFLSYVNSKVFKFLLKHSDTGSRALPIGSIKKFPTVSFDREWTDEALYEHFNLSVEDIDQFSDLP